MNRHVGTVRGDQVVLNFKSSLGAVGQGLSDIEHLVRGR